MLSKKTLIPAGVLVAACLLAPSFQSCDEDSKSTLINSLIDNLLDWTSRDSTNYLMGTWACVDETNGIYDTLRFSQMTQTAASYDGYNVAYSGTYSDHYVYKDSTDYVDKGVYSYIKSQKEVLISVPSSTIYKYDGVNYGGQVTDDGSVYEYGASVTKVSITSEYGIHQLTLTSYSDNVVVSQTTYQYVEE